MKTIDRVIFCLNNNETYIDFWNYVAKLYKLKFNVTPTLMFVGTTQEYETLSNAGRLSQKYGEVIHLQRVEEVPYNAGSGEWLDWTPTWALFYGASLFPNEVCMISGIDQIPLSPMFFEIVKEINTNQKYVIGFADAYNVIGNMKTASLENEDKFVVYPSSHHVALGKIYKDVYEIEDSWEDEIKKVNSYIGKFTLNEDLSAYAFSKGWGIDEIYSSYKISKKSSDYFFLVNDWYKNWVHKRIDRSFQGKLVLNTELENRIINKDIPEYSAIRPFFSNDINSMNRLLEIIPEYENYR
jgi:hypothetical protein